jgi:peptidyl-prolyl cis-trans isomerase C
MVRRMAGCLPRARCFSAWLALILALLAWSPGPGAIGRARAEVLSNGIFTDQPSQNDVPPADPGNPPDASTSDPFKGIRPPAVNLANAASPSQDPMVANVEGHPIFLSELGDAMQSLPEQLRKMPFEVIFPMLVDRMVDHEALVLMARREKLDDDPKVKRQIETVTARVLEGALLERTAVSQVTDAAIKARYQQDFATQPAVEEVHARHILVGTEAEAKRLIVELNKGSDFATLARRFSKDPDGARGGDLGFFRHDQVWPGFADLAFSLKPGEIAQTPIENEFGWHVVQTLERRTVPPPTFDQAREAIRKQLLQEAVKRVVAEAREGLRVHRYNLDGSPMIGSSIGDDINAPSPDQSRRDARQDARNATGSTAGGTSAGSPASSVAPPTQVPAPARAPSVPRKPAN